LEIAAYWSIEKPKREKKQHQNEKLKTILANDEKCINKSWLIQEKQNEKPVIKNGLDMLWKIFENWLVKKERGRRQTICEHVHKKLIKFWWWWIRWLER